jgi:hypothetical protein
MAEDGSAPDDDAGDASTLVLPQVLGMNSGTMATPKLIAVTFPGDTQAADINTFTKAIGASAYWKAVVGEYGVGAATGGAIGLTETAPASIDQDKGDSESWLASRFDGTHPEWGTFDPNALYLVFYPSSTTTPQAVGGCGGAYHNSITVSVANGNDAGTTQQNLIYGIVFRCDSTIDVGRPTGLDLTTSMASHEMVEAATDPQGNGYLMTDLNHIGWGYFLGSEVGDMCAFHAGVWIKPQDLGYTVQRTWSNAAATAFQDPCVPGASDPLFMAAPIGLTSISLQDGNGGTFSTQGVQVPTGQTKTVDLRLYGSAASPWTVQPFTYLMEHGQAEPYLKFALDKTTGQSGDVIHLSITRLADNPNGIGGDAVKIISSLGTVTNEWYLPVAQ